MDVVVTDHHEVPCEEDEAGNKTYHLPLADAIVNPKQADCTYPFAGICGATVAFKLLMVIYDLKGKPKEAIFEFLEIVAMATITDVMELKDENRILVSFGLNQMRKTKNLGLHALMQVNKIAKASLSAYHIGFIIGPCLNASGRLDTAKKALELLKSTSEAQATSFAEELKALNESRKAMTLEQTEKAIKKIEESSLKEDKVLVVVLRGCHESLAGIIAGRLREHYHRPAIVITDVEDGFKGSGRSIPAYDMFAEVSKQKHLLSRFGGHPMACGLSIAGEHIDEFRKALNQQTTLTSDDFIPIVSIDLALPPEYITENLIQEFTRLEPFGNGNSRPLFAGKGFTVSKAQVLGVNKNVLKFQLSTVNHYSIPAIYFGDIDGVLQKIQEIFGMEEYGKMMKGEENKVKLLLTFYPQINEFRGVKTIQLVIQNVDCLMDKSYNTTN
jgi:single-stranded-DNA-specific exonuclease